MTVHLVDTCPAYVVLRIVDTEDVGAGPASRDLVQGATFCGIACEVTFLKQNPAFVGCVRVFPALPARLAWCTADRARRFFGSWFEIEGYRQVGHFLGHEAIRAQQELRPALERYVSGETPAQV